MNPEPPVTSTREPCSAVICSPFAVATSKLCLTRFYRDPAGGVAWSGEAIRYDPAAMSLVVLRAFRGPVLVTGFRAPLSVEVPGAPPWQPGSGRRVARSSLGLVPHGAWTV